MEEFCISKFFSKKILKNPNFFCLPIIKEVFFYSQGEWLFRWDCVIYPESQENYIDYYMAKNLYVLEVNTYNQAEPEGRRSHQQGSHVALVPQGVAYPDTDYNTTDEEWFWQAPE